MRTLWTNRTFSLISLSGLAIGLATTLLIVLYVAHEYGYDRFHVNGARIVKVELRHKDGAEEYSVPWMSYRFGEAVKKACPEVDDFARIKDKQFGSKLVQSDVNHKFFESNFLFVDAGFIRLFSFPFVRGNPRTALTRPATILLTQTTARKYFGTTDPIGKTITYDKQHRFEVVGVLSDPPSNSSIKFDFLAQIDTYRAIERANYLGFLNPEKAEAELESVGTSGGYDTYFLLNESTATDQVARKIPSLLTNRQAVDSRKESYNLYPLFDLHFTVFAKYAPRNITIFSVIAILILALALINYASLSTARSTIRAKEVSLRKVVGAARQALIFQFYLESALYVTIAFGLAILLFTVVQPVFYETIHLQIDPSFLVNPSFITASILLFAVSIFLSGSYPALLLSRFNPIQVLKGRFLFQHGATVVRRLLIVFQFTVSITLIIGSILISNQLSLLLTKDVGLDRQRIISVHLDPEDGLDKHYQAIRTDIRQLSGVEAATASSLMIYDNYLNSWDIKTRAVRKPISVNTFAVDEEFIKTLNIQWAIPPKDGQEWTTKNRMVLNETAAKRLGIDAGNVEQALDLGQGMTKNLVGVIKDFNYQSLTQSVRPMGLMIAADTTFREYLYIKLAKNAPTETSLTQIEQIYDRYKTDKPFAYFFLDQTYQRLYESQISMSRIILVFTCLAVLIACLGLFGLAAFTAEQRTKEIGVRKVLGASVSSLVVLLSKDFLRLVLVAIIIASPLAYYAMNRWLTDFAYRTEISWWVFALSGLLAVSIALLTVSVQSVRAALINPAKSLRTE